MSDPEDMDNAYGEDEEGEFELNEDEMVEIGDDEDYVPEGGEGLELEIVDGDEQDDENEDDIIDDSQEKFMGHNNEPIYAVAVSHKGSQVVSGGGDDQAFLWTAEKVTGTRVSKHSDSVVAVAFSADDEWIATGGMDGVVVVKNKATEMKLEGPGSDIEWVAWHPKHNILLAGSADTTVWMFNIAEEGAMMGVFAGHNDVVTCGSFTPNGRRVVTGSMDGTLKLWEPNGSNLIHTFGGHGFHEGGVVAMAFKEGEDPIVATGGSDGTVCMVRLDTKKILSKFVHKEVSGSTRRPAQRQMNEDGEEEDGEVEEEMDDGVSVETVVFCPTLPWLVSGGTDGRVIVWDLSVQAKRSVLVHPDSHAVVRCIFLPQSVKLITACADGKVRKYDARSTTLESTLSGHRDAILDMVLLADGKRVVTASDDGTARVFVVG